MKYSDIVSMLEEAGLPLAYDHFAEGESPDPPFIVFLFPGSDNVFADDTVYYMVANNNGYSGDFELALIPESFLTDVLKEVEDANGVIAENKDVEPEHFALLFEFSGDQRKIRHCMYYCSATRPSVSGSTKEDSTEVQTETLSLTVSPLPSGLVKVKTGTNTSQAVYDAWYESVYQPSASSGTEVAEEVAGE